MEGHSFHIVSGDLPETMRKQYLSTKLKQQEIRWNYGILRSERGLAWIHVSAKSEKVSKDIYQNLRDALPDLVPFIQFKKREKQQWRTVTFNKVASCKFTKGNTPLWVFFTFFKLYKWYQITKNITNIFNV